MRLPSVPWWIEAVAIWAGAGLVLSIARKAAAASLDLPSAQDPANDYLWIAENGYPVGTWRLGWLPGYSLAIRAVGVLGLDTAAAARAITVVAGLAAVVLLAAWVRRRGGSRRMARWSMLAFVLWPNGFALITPAILSEALFIALVLSACVLVERGNRAAAAVLLMGACATRLAGIAFVIGLTLRSLELSGALDRSHGLRSRLSRLRFDPSRLRLGDLLPLAGFVGLAAFLAYSAIVHGDALAYFRIQSSLTPSGPRWHPLTLVHAPLVLHSPDLAAERPGHLAYSWLAAIAVLATAATIPAVVRRFGIGYGVTVAVLVALIWFGPWDFSSAFRYLLAAFPVFAVWGRFLAERATVGVALLGLSAAGLLWFSVIYYAGQTLATW